MGLTQVPYPFDQSLKHEIKPNEYVIRVLKRMFYSSIQVLVDQALQEISSSHVMLDMASFGKYFFTPSLPIKKKEKKKRICFVSHVSWIMQRKERTVPIHSWFCASVSSCNIERVPSSVLTLPLQAVIEGRRQGHYHLLK